MAIVVTCFNSGSTLPDTIASIRSCGTQVELVVVDDGSTDPSTHAVLAELEQQGARVICQQNLGQAAAANAGVRVTTAPYVMRFDSDDLLEPGALEALADALDETPSASLAWGDFQTFGLTTFVVPGALALDPWLVTYVNLIPGSGALIRRTALDATGGWRLSEGFEDWDLWMSFADRGYIGTYVPGIVFRYRRRRSSRQGQARHATTCYYQHLLKLHPELCQKRRCNRSRSDAPVALKLLISLIEALPFVSRITKVTSCELAARLIWRRAPYRVFEMFRQGLLLRGRMCWGRE